MSAAVRKFEDHPAVRTATPLLFGIVGPSSSGKTFSALRLATGMRRVVGGPPPFVIDTESGRALHYADRFEYRHVPFAPPFSPLDYVAAIEYAVERGAKIIIIDSLSHEHSGQGGVLEWHAEEVERIMAAWRCNEEKANIPAWNKPKSARRKLINCITQANVNIIACFRAKDKIKIGQGKVVQMGWMPDAGEEFVYELTAKALLMPGAEGVPTWQPEQPGEKMMVKLPEQFRGIFSGAAGKPLDENIGEQLARWAAGADKPDLATAYEACNDAATFEQLEKRRADAWKSLSAPEKRAVKAASDAAAERLKSQPAERVDRETGEVLTLDGNAPATPTVEDLERELRGAKALPALDAIWDRVEGAYGQDVPIELDAAYREMREALEGGQ